MGRQKKQSTPEETIEKERLKAEKLAEKKKLETRRERELLLYLSGGSFRQIAEPISRGGEEVSKSTVEKDINLLLDRETDESDQYFKRVRRKAVKQLEALVLPYMSGAQQGDVKKGELIVKIIDKIVDLSGAKRPTQIENSGKIETVEYTLAEWKAEQRKRREQAAKTGEMFSEPKN